MKKYFKLSLIILILLSMASCMKPYKTPVYVDVSPNQTAFVVPLETMSLDGQEQVRSIAFLEQSKVQAKRIQIPQRWNQQGYLSNSGEYIGTMQVITVDRSPVSRVWTADKDSGTSSVKQAIWVETSDSIEFAMAISMTARILENDTAKFLYQFSGRQLSSVMDSDLRSAVMNKMNAKFGTLPLAEATTEKVRIMKEVGDEITLMAKDWGIDITTVGSAGGMVYKDASIQRQINDTFTAEKSVAIAKQKKLAQDEKNKQDVATAQAEVDAAKKWNQAATIYERKILLDVMRMEAEAKLKWNGQYPSNMMVLPEGSNLLLTPGGK